ncbi:PEPxxWA-CTERM sorting domain-containing protein [Sphingomonas sp.]|uniref:PEPxxWA-CTERM sorting domain-containing protein n=1 Tax=Sphingomonas sp. TaxID=28214 RepID=UPI003CC5054C
MFKKLVQAAAVGTLFFSGAAYAQTTTTSPTGGALPAGVTKVGGVVVDLTGTNGNRIVSQLSAASLFVGFSTDPATKPGTSNGNPLVFGTQTGFTSTVLSALGGGLTGASFRITLYDGDNAPGDFDFNDNTFTVDGINFGNWSAVATTVTDSNGNPTSTGLGFGDNVLATGFFSSVNPVTLASLFTALQDGSLAFAVNDVDPGDNYYDFTQGINGGLINVGTGPVVTPPSVGAVPEPASWALMILGFGLAGFALRRVARRSDAKFDTKIREITAGAIA